MKKIETIGTYHICKDDSGKYWALRDEWLDSKSRLVRQVNGLEGMLSDTLEECRERVENQVAVDELVSQGVHVAVACVMVCAAPEWRGKSREEIEENFRKIGIKF